MQAYKGLYEDQLQTQHASAESYRSLTRGYSRLSADNKALRRETTAVAAFAAAARDAAGNAAALIASSADLQQGIRASSPLSLRPRAEDLCRDESTGLNKKDLREEEEARVDDDGDSKIVVGVRNVAIPGSGEHSASSRGAGSPEFALPGVGGADDSGNGLAVKSAHARATPAESAAAVATAAEAVAAAAGALAQAANTASATVDGAGAGEEPSEVLPRLPFATKKGKAEDATAVLAQARDRADSSFRKGRTVVEDCDARDRTGARIPSLAETNRPNTAETLACSPFSEKAADNPAAVAGALVTATKTQNSRDTPLRNDGAPASGRAPPADCFVDPGGAALETGAFVHGGGDRGRSGSAGVGDTKGYAFSQTAEEEDLSFLTGGAASAAAASSTQQGLLNNISAVSRVGDAGGGGSDDRPRLSTDEKTSKADELFSAREKRSDRDARPEGHARLARGVAVAVPPEKPAPHWRGRSAGPGRLLASSASWTDTAEVDAPKRSSSPTGPRRGRWGDCAGAGGGAWGGARGAAAGEEEGCIRIEPSCRARPRSI